jgi:hypothetical protein
MAEFSLTERHVKVLLRLETASVGLVVITAVVAAALGWTTGGWLWLMVAAGVTGLASSLVRRTRPAASAYLILGSAMLSVAATIVMLVTLR